MTDTELAHRIEVASYRRRSRYSTRGPNQLVPENTVAGNALTVVIAIMSFLACLTLGAVTLVRDASRDWQLDVQRELTIQVRPIDGVDVAAETAKAADLARQTPGIAGADVLDDAANAKLLEPWLGQGLDIADLPIPHLVVVRLSDPRAVDLAELKRKLTSEIKGAELDDHRVWASRLQSLANTTVFAGVAILGLVFVATVLCVVFATRGAMATNSGVVSVLHLVGAEDGFHRTRIPTPFSAARTARRTHRGSRRRGFVRDPRSPAHPGALRQRPRPGLRSLRPFRRRPDRVFRRPWHCFPDRGNDRADIAPDRVPLLGGRRMIGHDGRLQATGYRLGEGMSDAAHDQTAAARPPHPLSEPKRPRRNMRLILIIAGICVAALAVGFVVFAEDVANPPVPSDPRAEGIVVLTGGSARIDGALHLFLDGRGSRVLISGVNPAVTSAALANSLDSSLSNAFACCVDLGRAAQDTIGNAEETRHWAEQLHFSSLLVVTSDYHMRRSMAELARAMPNVRLTPVPIASPELGREPWWSNPAAIGLLAREYGKYLLTLARVTLAPAAGAAATDSSTR